MPPPTKAPPKPPPSRKPSQSTSPAPPAAGDLPQLTIPEPVFPPPRVVLNAVEGWGKTTAGAHAEKPAILMARGEAGYTTLLGVGSVPAIPAATIDTWPQLLGVLDQLIAETDRKTLVLDALGGFERLCHEHVCDRDFKGDWGERGFVGFQRGYEVALPDWLQMLARLDRLQANGVTILLLSHPKIEPFRNPLGVDFDRYVSAVHKRTREITSKWVDAMLFGAFYSVIEGGKLPEGTRPGRKGKGIGGTDRVIYCERRDGYDAKNRYGMPESINIPNEPAEVWNTIWAAITNGKDGD